MSELRATMKLSRGELAIDIDFACPPGITCLMGPSGAGKSTVLGVLAGLTQPDAGTVALGEETWLDRARGIDVPVHQRRLSYVFQGLALFPHMTVQKNVEYGIDLPAEKRAERALALLDRMSVKQLAQRRPKTLSGGERQRVALARALAREPKLLLLDEPFSALDQALRDQLGALVKELVAELKIPAIHVTHSLEEAKQLGDRIIRIESGRVV